MKKFITNIYAVVLVAMASATFTACSSDDAEDVQPAGKKVYTLTVNADKDADTRALAVDGDNITATWEAGDVVKVYNGTEEVGELTAQSSGASTTLSGAVTVDTSITSLTLKYNSADYDNQDGTLESIAANCDYAEATISGFTFEGTNITSASTAEFENKQAVVKLSLLDKADGNDITATKVKVNDITLTLATASNVVYVAVPAVTGVSLEALVNGDIYAYNKADAELANGAYYNINVEMTKVAVDLGLPSGTLWATTNIGATTEEGVGLYFAWSETTGYADATTYTFSQTATLSASNKYKTAGATLLPEDDAAYVNCGAEWHTPNATEANELKNNTNREWTQVNGVYGFKVTSKSDATKYIFLPVTGYYINGALNGTDKGWYWLSQNVTGTNASVGSHAGDLNIYSPSTFSVSDKYGLIRQRGCNIRPVRSAF